MPKIPILCMSCGASIPEEEYLQHMQGVHGTIHTDEAMKKERTKKANIPAPVVPTELPLGVRPEDLPSPEFLEIAKEIDTAPPLSPLPKLDLSKSPTSSTPQSVATSHPATSQTPIIKSLELKYVWIGNCPTCTNTVETIMIEAGEELWSNAYCLKCKETIKQIKVHPIEKVRQVSTPAEVVKKSKKEIEKHE